MSKFIKKPVTIDALQWNVGDPPLSCMQSYDKLNMEELAVLKGFYFIETPEGNYHVSDGDWVITDVNGKNYPCKPDEFEKTYWSEEEYTGFLKKVLEP